MPVPVPLVSKPVAHPVIKQNRAGQPDHFRPSVFQQLTLTLPVSPRRPPPSFGTREEWIKSLPSWRRTKPRRIWEDDSRLAEERNQHHFQEGLTVADNAPVIKGTRAQACIPPLFTLLENLPLTPTALADSGPGFDEDADDELSSESSIMDQSLYDNGSQWTASSPAAIADDDIDMEQHSQFDAGDCSVYADEMGIDGRTYERGAFTPVFEEDSPETGIEVASSPLGPITPFGEFVDRAVAATQTSQALDNYSAAHPVYEDKLCGPQCYQAASLLQPEVPKEPAPPEPVVTPSASESYRKLAEPLAEWVANYVWKVCTTGMSLPVTFSQPLNFPAKQYSSSPPTLLASSVHSLLLSTLLQPSAVFLAVWYIVRLPIYFDAAALPASHVREILFRAELLGNGSLDRDALETTAPFRLILLGCMLANKWLDDHTFSNKTWHTISNVSIHSVNKLESLTLDIFSYDLSVPPRAWSQWLSYVISYHLSLSSPSHPRPIGRPSTNPHSIVRRAIEELMQAPNTSGSNHLHGTGLKSEPVYLGLEERRREKFERERAARIDSLEIDLDEDGPLREEYMPKRRTSGASSMRSFQSSDQSGPKVYTQKRPNWERNPSYEVEKHLPPPAKWSPEGDEPILREKNRGAGHYVAVQPQRPIANTLAPISVPSLYHCTDVKHQDYSLTGYHSIKPNMMPGHGFQAPTPYDVPTACDAYPCVHPPQSHLRSHSLSYDQENLQPREHYRSYSQTRSEYKRNDLGVTANELRAAPPPQPRWPGAGHHGYQLPFIQPLDPHPNVNYQSTMWLRT